MDRMDAPAPELLAAWLDGRLDEERAAPVEAWLATDDGLAALVSLRAALAEPAPAATTEQARRAAALVAPARAAPRPASPLRRLLTALRPDPTAGFGFAATAAAALVGVYLGWATHDLDASADEAVTAVASFGLVQGD